MSSTAKGKCYFYTTDGCHLCEQALSMLQPLATRHKIALQLIDIASDEALVTEYGLRIPVLRHPASGVELNWPFAEDEVLKVISSPLTA